MHLHHGLWSMTQSLGAADDTLAPRIQIAAVAASILIAAGFAVIPLAVMVRYLH